MTQLVILDTGPLVAALKKRDAYHQWVREQLGEIACPMLTCESVISETLFLLKDTPNSLEQLIGLVNRGIIEVRFDLGGEFEHVAYLLAKYQSVPMSLADACLVRMAEMYPNRKIITFDSDFQIYRKHRNQQINLIMPERM